MTSATDTDPVQLELDLDLPPVTPAPSECVTAFLIIVNKDGTIEATSELTRALAVQREANLADMRSAAHSVIDDANGMLVAQRVQAGIKAAAEAALEAQQVQTVAAALRNKLQARGIVVPDSVR